MNKLAILIPALALSVSAHAGTKAPNPVTNPIGAVFAKIASGRGGRAFHKEGAAYRATFTDRFGTEHNAVARVSRGGVTKDGKSDIQGLAIKEYTAGGPQDFTLIGTKPLMTSTLAGQSMSSVTPYQMGKTRGQVVTQLPASFHTGMDNTPEHPAGDQSFKLQMRSKKLFRPATTKDVGNVTVHFAERLSASEEKNLEFNPYHDAGGIKPKGVINWIRKIAMHGSQEGRGAPADKNLK